MSFLGLGGDAKKKIFAEFDADGSGKINASELMLALQKGGKKVTEEEVSDIIRKVDTDEDGEISFEEFEAIFKLAPDALPPGVKQVVDVSGFFMKSVQDAAKVLTPPATPPSASPPGWPPSGKQSPTSPISVSNFRYNVECIAESLGLTDLLPNMAKVVKEANSAMGVKPIGTLPEQSSKLMIDLGLDVTSLPPQLLEALEKRKEAAAAARKAASK